MNRLFFLFAFLLSSFSALHATAYHIGPGQTYENLGEAPWVDLVAGDTVYIHWRAEPYAAKIFLRAQGTEDQPVVIRGVPNAAGELPLLTGENATTDEQFIGYFNSQWTEDLGMFLIYRGPNDDYYTDVPSHIVFEYLAMTGVKPQNTFTDQFGQTRHYNSFSSAIHALIVQGLTVRHCKIYDNAQGIFTNSYGGSMTQMSTDLLIEYNQIWGNGNADSDGTEHNIYAQSLGTIIQYNYLGRLRPGSAGATLKDRSSGTIIRYNWIEASPRTLDLVEAEEGWEITTVQDDYHDVYVYGNVFTNYLSLDPFGVNNIHYGYDNSPNLGKKGTLYFFHNTVYFETDQSIYWYVHLFDLSSGENTVEMYNNILHASGTSEFRLMRDYGVLNIQANNWIQEGYYDQYPGSDAVVNIIEQPMTGVDPGFADVATEDFRLTANSNCVDAAADLPPDIAAAYPLEWQYVKHAGAMPRDTIGAGPDLGAFEYGAPVSVVEQLRPSLQLYPNPTTDKLLVLAPGAPNQKYVLYDLFGKHIKTGVLQTGSEVDVSFLSPGVYLLEVKTARGASVLKFVKK